MNILFDVNVVVDVLGKSDDFVASYSSYDVTLARGFTPFISVSSVNDIVYVLQARKYLSKKQARDSVGSLLIAFDVLDTIPSDCDQANDSEMADFEDALIAYSAFRNNIDFIITRNKRDFVASPVPALTPEEFLHIYKPDNLEYEEVVLG